MTSLPVFLSRQKPEHVFTLFSVCYVAATDLITIVAIIIIIVVSSFVIMIMCVDVLSPC